MMSGVPPIGGSYKDQSYEYHYLNDVWSSADGVNWRRETANAAFPGRDQHTCETFNGRMWILGGGTGYRFGDRQYFNDTWSSVDGVIWRKEAAGSPMLQREGHASEVFGGRLWVVAGLRHYDGYDFNNDVLSWSGLNSASFTIELPTAAPGPFNGYLQFRANDPANPVFHLGVTGTITSGPELSFLDHGVQLSPGIRVDLGETPRGGPPLRRSLVEENKGDTPLQIARVDLPIGLRVIEALPASLSANSAATLTLELASTAISGRFEYPVQLTSNDENHGQFTISIMGMVQPAPTLAIYDGVTTVPNRGGPVEFGTMPRGGMPLHKRLRLENHGDAPWVFTRIQTPPGYALAGDWPTTATMTPLSWLCATPDAGFSNRTQFGNAVFNGRLWVIGGTGGVNDNDRSDLWSSADGIHWRRELPGAGFGARSRIGCVVFKGRLWLIGTDVWSSADGLEWCQENPALCFAPSEGQSCVVFQDKLWVIGSWNKGDIWSSPDGRHWDKMATVPEVANRFGHSCVVFVNRLWVIAGYRSRNEETADVWSSADGIHWCEEIKSGAFSLRQSQACVVQHDRIWLVGGRKFWDVYDDVWSSADGVNWRRECEHAPWAGRWGQTCLPFNDRIWVVAGNTGYCSSLSDVWWLNFKQEPTTFTLEFKAPRTGLATGMCALQTNDPVNQPYRFEVAGTGLPSGTVIVDVTPNQAGWALTDGLGLSRNGVGDATLEAVLCDRVSLIWKELTNYDRPTPQTESQILGDGAIIRFTGAYLRHCVMVRVEVTPEDAPWTLTDGDQAEHSGQGSATLADIPTGQVSLAAGPLSGYVAPEPAVVNGQLAKGGSITLRLACRPAPPALATEPAWTSGTLNTIRWSAPAPATTCTLECSASPAFTQPILQQMLPAPAGACTFSGLTDGQTWHYRACATDRYGTVGPWSAPVHSAQNAIAPTGTIRVPDELACTSQTTVRLQVAAQDGGTTPSGVTALRLSHADAGWGDWQPIAAETTGTLGPADGPYVLRTQFRDEAGNVSAEAVATTVTLDTVPPRSRLTVPASMVGEPVFSLQWTAEDTGSGPRQIEIRWHKEPYAEVSLGRFPADWGGLTFDTREHGGNGVYAFTSRAMDRAGNVETKDQPDATITVQVNTIADTSWLYCE